MFVPELLAALHDSEREVVTRAGSILGSFGSKADKAVPALFDALKDRRSRFAAAGALARIRPNDPAVANQLILQLGDKEDVLGRRCVMWALAAYGAAAAPAVPVLIEALNDLHADKGDVHRTFRSTAIYALRCIGKDAKAAVPKLLAIVKDTREDDSTRKYVAQSLFFIDQEAGKNAETILNAQLSP